MFFILGCALPNVDDRQRERLCLLWLERLAGRLDLGQVKHINRFGRSGKPLGMRMARILGRLMALSQTPAGSQIRTNKAGLPYIQNFALSFSYTEKAAFCALYHGAKNNDKLRLGLDAEEWTNDNLNKCENKFVNAGALKNWLTFEALFKAKGTGLAARKDLTKSDGFNTRYLAFPGHLLCLASNASLQCDLRWLHYHGLG